MAREQTKARSVAASIAYAAVVFCINPHICSADDKASTLAECAGVGHRVIGTQAGDVLVYVVKWEELRKRWTGEKGRTLDKAHTVSMSKTTPDGHPLLVVMVREASDQGPTTTAINQQRDLARYVGSTILGSPICDTDADRSYNIAVSGNDVLFVERLSSANKGAARATSGSLAGIILAVAVALKWNDDDFLRAGLSHIGDEADNPIGTTESKGEDLRNDVYVQEMSNHCDVEKTKGGDRARQCGTWLTLYGLLTGSPKFKRTGRDDARDTIARMIALNRKAQGANPSSRFYDGPDPEAVQVKKFWSYSDWKWPWGQGARTARMSTAATALSCVIADPFVQSEGATVGSDAVPGQRDEGKVRLARDLALHHPELGIATIGLICAEAEDPKNPKVAPQLAAWRTRLDELGAAFPEHAHLYRGLRDKIRVDSTGNAVELDGPGTRDFCNRERRNWMDDMYGIFKSIKDQNIRLFDANDDNEGFTIENVLRACDGKTGCAKIWYGIPPLEVKLIGPRVAPPTEIPWTIFSLPDIAIRIEPKPAPVAVATVPLPAAPAEPPKPAQPVAPSASATPTAPGASAPSLTQGTPVARTPSGTPAQPTNPGPRAGPRVPTPPAVLAVPVQPATPSSPPVPLQPPSAPVAPKRPTKGYPSTFTAWSFWSPELRWRFDSHALTRPWETPSPLGPGGQLEWRAPRDWRWLEDARRSAWTVESRRTEAWRSVPDHQRWMIDRNTNGWRNGDTRPLSLRWRLDVEAWSWNTSTQGETWQTWFDHDSWQHQSAGFLGAHWSSASGVFAPRAEAWRVALGHEHWRQQSTTDAQAGHWVSDVQTEPTTERWRTGVVASKKLIWRAAPSVAGWATHVPALAEERAAWAVATPRRDIWRSVSEPPQRMEPEPAMASWQPALAFQSTQSGRGASDLVCQLWRAVPPPKNTPRPASEDEDKGKGKGTLFLTFGPFHPRDQNLPYMTQVEDALSSISEIALFWAEHNSKTFLVARIPLQWLLGGGGVTNKSRAGAPVQSEKNAPADLRLELCFPATWMD